MFESVRDLQPGDPERLGGAIEKVLSLENPPTRIPFGSDAINMVQKHATQQLADLEKFKEISTSTDFDPMPEATRQMLKAVLH